MPRVGLTREIVIHAAAALADRHGITGVTMRALAAELDVEAMSLYNHVANKDDVLRGIVGVVWGEVDLAAEEPDWRKALHRLCESAHRAMIRHPWYFAVPLTYGGLGHMRVVQAILALLERGGVDDDRAFHALHVLEGHMYGYSWQAIGYGDMDAIAEESAPPLATIDPAEFPHLLSHASLHTEPPSGDGFAFGLDILLDGLEATRR